MNLVDVALLQLFAHMLGDFYFQTDNSCKCKEYVDADTKKQSMVAHLKHGLVVFLCSYAGFVVVGYYTAANIGYYWQTSGLSLLLVLLHLEIDLVKSGFLARKENKSSAVSRLFFYDQFAHFITIACAVCLFSIVGAPKWVWVTTNSTKGITYLFAVFFLCKPANVVIKYVLEGFELNPESEEPSLKNAGRLIGICERILLFLLLLKGLYTEAGLVLGAKSILRYNNTGKNEYVLVGTLLSVTVVAVVYAVFDVAGLV